MEEAKRKSPMRKCVGCNNHFEKKSLIRILRSPEGEIKLDFTGKMNGRGAYICKNTQCLKKAIKQKRLDSVLETSVPEEIYSKLSEELSNENN